VVHFTTSDHKPIRGAFEIQLNLPVRLREPKMRYEVFACVVCMSCNVGGGIVAHYYSFIHI